MHTTSFRPIKETSGCRLVWALMQSLVAISRALPAVASPTQARRFHARPWQRPALGGMNGRGREEASWIPRLASARICCSLKVCAAAATPRLHRLKRRTSFLASSCMRPRAAPRSPTSSRDCPSALHVCCHLHRRRATEFVEVSEPYVRACVVP